MDVYVASTGHISVRPSSPNPSVLFNSICSGSEKHLFPIRIKMKTIVFNCLANGVTHKSEIFEHYPQWQYITHVFLNAVPRISTNKKKKNKRWHESRRKPTPAHHHKVAWPKVAPHTCVYGRGRLKKSTCDSAHRFCSP